MKKLYIMLAFLLLTPFGGAEAATFFADFGVVGCSGAGTASTTSFCSIDDFTEVARAQGDQLFVRRGTSTTTGTSQLDFTSDGTIADPIVVSADYDNIWGDFSTSTQTFTLAVGSSTMTASANITGIAAGDWIYVYQDQFESASAPTVVDKIYSYEVKSVSGTQLQLYFPYNGMQTGAGNSLRVMPDNPIRGNTTDNLIAASFGTDGGWMMKGLDLRGTSASGVVVVQSSGGVDFSDMILRGDDAGVMGFSFTGGAGFATGALISKSRTFAVRDVFDISSANGANVVINDFFADCDNTSSVNVIDNRATGVVILKVNNLTSTNCPIGLEYGSTATGNASFTKTYLRNSKFLNVASSSQLLFTNDSTVFKEAYIEDANGYIGENYFTTSAFSTTSEKITIQKTLNTRNASTYSSLLVRSSPYFSNKRKDSMLQLFEYPIYTDTTSKTYSVFFSSTSTAGWTADPTASEMWIECEYWAHPVTTGTTTRAVKRSTGVLDFNGSTAWQSLAVTCQPTATGVLYLRGWYGKPQESGKSNWFYVDPTPVIS